MATIQFRLRSNANKNVSIKIRLSIQRGNDFELNTGFVINPKDWNDAKGCPKQTTPENKLLANHLIKLQSFVFENLNQDLSNGTLIDSYWLETKIKECFNRVEKSSSNLIYNHIQYIIDNANTRKIIGKNKIGLSQSRIKGYNSFKNLIGVYQTETKKKINFLDINKNFVDKFTNWLINDKKYSINYAGKQIDNLKTVCNDARNSEIPTNDYINQIHGFAENDEDRNFVTLSFEELEQIQNTEMPTDALNNARNWLLIGCEIGQRGGDLLNITKKNVRYNKEGILYLDIIQQKTKKSVTIPISKPHIVDIIENEFPYKVSSQKFNETIKKVGKIAKIDTVLIGRKLNPITKRKEESKLPKYEFMSSHCFRRSFATNYYKSMPTAILINITGHSKESMFLKYINQQEDKDANAELFLKYQLELLNEKKPIIKSLKKVI